MEIKKSTSFQDKPIRININTTLLNELWLLLGTGQEQQAHAILTNLKAYEALRAKAKEEYQKGNKTQYRAILEQINAFVKDNDLQAYAD